MTVQQDPKNNERKALHSFTDFVNKRVLEIGCGEGRLTWKYAASAKQGIGIELDRDALRVAAVDKPSDLEHKVLFTCAASEYLPFSKETFDIAILAWSF